VWEAARRGDVAALRAAGGSTEEADDVRRGVGTPSLLCHPTTTTPPRSHCGRTATRLLRRSTEGPPRGRPPPHAGWGEPDGAQQGGLWVRWWWSDVGQAAVVSSVGRSPLPFTRPRLARSSALRGLAGARPSGPQHRSGGPCDGWPRRAAVLSSYSQLYDRVHMAPPSAPLLCLLYV